MGPRRNTRAVPRRKTSAILHHLLKHMFHLTNASLGAIIVSIHYMMFTFACKCSKDGNPLETVAGAVS